MSTTINNQDVRFNGAVNMSTASEVRYKAGSITNADLSTSADIARSKLGQDALAVYDLSLESWRATGTGALLGSSAGTPSGAFGITYGTFGTASPKIVSQSASGASITNLMRRTFCLPPEYDDAETVTLRVRCRVTALPNTSQTIDAEVYTFDGDTTVTGDIVSTTAQSITASFANYDFTVTPTTLSSGTRLDIEITGVVDDTGGTTGSILEIESVSLLADIRG